MDFTLDKKHEMARGLFRDFAETESCGTRKRVFCLDIALV